MLWEAELLASGSGQKLQAGGYGATHSFFHFTQMGGQGRRAWLVSERVVIEESWIIVHNRLGI